MFMGFFIKLIGHILRAIIVVVKFIPWLYELKPSKSPHILPGNVEGSSLFSSALSRLTPTEFANLRCGT
jgi:hypothetical protein